MMNLKDLHIIYFLGIGGIGMSALARYFHARGVMVSGYDRTSTPLTDQLQEEGIRVHFEEDIAAIPANTDLVIITPAIPANNIELLFLQQSGITLMKRAELLGLLTNDMDCIAVAGTHGKTTTSTLIAHLFKNSDVGCTAVLGGISKNYNTNLLLSETSPFIVTEADEYDRSFMQLRPLMAIVTSTDADHLDIYGNAAQLKAAYADFAAQVKAGGFVIQRYGLNLDKQHNDKVKFYTYGFEDGADFRACNIRIINHRHHFDLISPFATITDLIPGNPGLINVENAIAALSIGLLAGINPEDLKKALSSYQGVVRRLDIRVERKDFVYIDDYAHHPEELRACISSVKELYPGVPVTGIFQPHLFTRTRDFASGFAESLDMLDDVILLDIYPAREEPIPGINSTMLLDRIQNTSKMLVSKEALLPLLITMQPRLLLTLGAGDIDQFVPLITKAFTPKINQGGTPDVA